MILPMCDNFDYIYEINNILKSQNISTNICYIEKGFKQKIRYADRMKNKYIIIIGDDEVQKNNIVLKNMIDGNQITINKKDLINIGKMIG